MEAYFGPLAAFASSFTWAVGTSVYAKLLQIYPSSVINTSRALVALILFVFAALATGVGPEALEAFHSKQVFWLFISILSSYALGDVLFFFSVQRLHVPAALTIASTYPLWSALGAYFLNGEKMHAHQWAGLCLTFIGVAVVILSGAGESRRLKDRRAIFIGFAFALMTSWFWALNSFSVGKGAAGLPTFLAGASRMGMALILCPMIGFAIGQKIGFVRSQDFKRYLWVFILEAFLGTLFFVYGFSHTPLAIAAALSSLAPVLSVPIARITTGERVGAKKFFGILLVTAGVILLVN